LINVKKFRLNVFARGSPVIYILGYTLLALSTGKASIPVIRYLRALQRNRFPEYDRTISSAEFRGSRTAGNIVMEQITFPPLTPNLAALKYGTHTGTEE